MPFLKEEKHLEDHDPSINDDLKNIEYSPKIKINPVHGHGPAIIDDSESKD